jgi:hypothetical protein
MRRQGIGGGIIALAIAMCGMPAIAEQTPQQVAQAPANGVIASAQFSQDPDLRCDLLEVKRVSGGALLVRWRLVNGAGQAGGAGGFASTSGGKKIFYNFSWDQLFVIDPAENKKYMVLTDSNNGRIAEVFEGDIAPGAQRIDWAKFPAPPTGSTKISVTIPKFAPFEDVPVAQ